MVVFFVGGGGGGRGESGCGPLTACYLVMDGHCPTLRATLPPSHPCSPSPPPSVPVCAACSAEPWPSSMLAPACNRKKQSTLHVCTPCNSAMVGFRNALLEGNLGAAAQHVRSGRIRYVRWACGLLPPALHTRPRTSTRTTRAPEFVVTPLPPSARPQLSHDHVQGGPLPHSRRVPWRLHIGGAMACGAHGSAHRRRGQVRASPPLCGPNGVG